MIKLCRILPAAPHPPFASPFWMIVPTVVLVCARFGISDASFAFLKYCTIVYLRVFYSNNCGNAIAKLLPIIVYCTHPQTMDGVDTQVQAFAGAGAPANAEHQPFFPSD